MVMMVFFVGKREVVLFKTSSFSLTFLSLSFTHSALEQHFFQTGFQTLTTTTTIFQWNEREAENPLFGIERILGEFALPSTQMYQRWQSLCREMGREYNVWLERERETGFLLPFSNIHRGLDGKKLLDGGNLKKKLMAPFGLPTGTRCEVLLFTLNLPSALSLSLSYRE